MIVEKLLHNC